MVARCKATNAAGAPCSAQPVRPSGWCSWHDPQLVAQRDGWRRRGGEQRSNKARALRRLSDDLLSLRDVQGVLSRLLVDVTEGRAETGVATAAASVARAIASVAQVGDLEERIRELEAAAGVQGGRTA